jgi:hypothetical protein
VKILIIILAIRIIVFLPHITERVLVPDEEVSIYICRVERVKKTDYHRRKAAVPQLGRRVRDYNRSLLGDWLIANCY